NRDHLPSADYRQRCQRAREKPRADLRGEFSDRADDWPRKTVRHDWRRRFAFEFHVALEHRRYDAREHFQQLLHARLWRRRRVFLQQARGGSRRLAVLPGVRPELRRAAKLWRPEIQQVRFLASKRRGGVYVLVESQSAGSEFFVRRRRSLGVDS